MDDILFCTVDKGYIHAFGIENKLDQVSNPIEINIGCSIPNIESGRPPSIRDCSEYKRRLTCRVRVFARVRLED